MTRGDPNTCLEVRKQVLGENMPELVSKGVGSGLYCRSWLGRLYGIWYDAIPTHLLYCLNQKLPASVSRQVTHSSCLSISGWQASVWREWRQWDAARWGLKEGRKWWVSLVIPGQHANWHNVAWEIVALQRELLAYEVVCNVLHSPKTTDDAHQPLLITRAPMCFSPFWCIPTISLLIPVSALSSTIFSFSFDMDIAAWVDMYMHGVHAVSYSRLDGLWGLPGPLPSPIVVNLSHTLHTLLTLLYQVSCLLSPSMWLLFLSSGPIHVYNWFSYCWFIIESMDPCSPFHIMMCWTRFLLTLGGTSWVSWRVWELFLLCAPQ